MTIPYYHIIFLSCISIFIFTECAPGKYGVYCEEACSAYCAEPGICHHQDGVCDCAEWVTGSTCHYIIGGNSFQTSTVNLY